MSVVMSWLFNGSQGNLVLAILGHHGINWAMFSAGEFTGQTEVSTWPAALGLTTLALVALVVTRGRLGLPGTSTR